ncbi:MAG: phenylalanine--tRNA ligase subunit alpha [Rhodobacteraceae bacterium]|nr:phenylalanine--tRNA ligase subunit alpha [Paracoccaceae bacterium]
MVDIDEIEKNYLDSISAVLSLEELEKVRVRGLGKKGEITTLMKSIGSMSEDERRIKAPKLNYLKSKVIEELDKKKTLITEENINKRIMSEWLDVSRPSRPSKVGKIHPISQVTEEVVTIFSALGFSVAEGPQIESDWYNFDALNIPPEHPARQEFDTFYVNSNTNSGSPPNVLRTHTSPVQIRHMEKKEGVPCRIIVPGKVFRSDYDQTHTPMFNQLEGLAIDKDLTMSHLKWTLEEFCRTFFEVDGVELRFRSSHFPFTEPSAEVDIRCSWEDGTLKLGQGNSWLEILGSGMVHPKVLTACNVDPNSYQGFAFGMGMDRLAMLKYGIPDLRGFFDGDVRWVDHFGFDPLNRLSIHSGFR